MARTPRRPRPSDAAVRRFRYQARGLLVLGLMIAVLATVALVDGWTTTSGGLVGLSAMLVCGLLSCVVGWAALAWISRRLR